MAILKELTQCYKIKKTNYVFGGVIFAVIVIFEPAQYAPQERLDKFKNIKL